MRSPLLVTLSLAPLACGGAQPAAPVVVDVSPLPVATSAPAPMPWAAEKAADAGPPAEEREVGMIGLLNSGAGGDPNAPTAPWGRDDSLGNDPLSARGNIWGTGKDDPPSARELGLSGIGDGPVGPNDAATPPASSGHVRATPPRVRMGAASVNGRLPPEVIQRIVRQNFGRFRLCYEDGLRNNPKLAGKVTTKFTIARDGSVSTAGDGGATTMPDAGTIACVTRAFGALSFPEPEGGTVTVVYPITFSPAEDAPVPAKQPATPAPKP